MTPAQMIALLDRQLALNGEDVVLRRRVGTSSVWTEVTVRGHFKGIGTDDLVGSTKQMYRVFILSPTLLNAAILAGHWPPQTDAEIDPKRGDELRGTDGISRRIESVQGKRPNGVCVRYDGQVLG